jgi:hypothetical protein
MPERWLPEEGSKIAEFRGQEYRLNQAAYMPFNYGTLVFGLDITSLTFITC